MELLAFGASTLTTLMLAVDPFAAVPLFLAITENENDLLRQRTAMRACLVALFTLTGFAIAGGSLFRVLGISLDAFRIAGGILLFLLALDMLRAQPSRQRSTPEERSEGREKNDVSVFPLAIPMLAGPGAITSVLMLAGRTSPVHRALVVFAVLLVVFVSFLLLRSAAFVERRLRKTGLNVVQRLMGLLLAGTAVQFVMDGARGFWLGMRG